MRFEVHISNNTTDVGTATDSTNKQVNRAGVHQVGLWLSKSQRHLHMYESC